MFDTIIETDEGVESVSKNADRFQSVVKRNTVDTVDQVYRTSCQVIEKFTTCMDHILRVEVYKHSDKFEYTRLVSKEGSTFQINHCDFATNSGNGWGEYMGAFNHSLMTPLSSLYFPEGGQLGYRNYQPRTIIQYYIDKFEKELQIAQQKLMFQIHYYWKFQKKKLKKLCHMLKLEINILSKEDYKLFF